MNRSKRLRSTPVLLALAALLLAGGAAAEAQTCVPNLAYVDLLGSGGQILSPPFEFLGESDATDDCPGSYRAAVLKVTIPTNCSCAVVWVEYVGEPHGWTLNVGDSPTNNGFGGDGGSAPAGQNAEVDVLDQRLTVWSAADNPADVDPLLMQHLGLTDGTLKLLVCDQYVSVGQPWSKLETPDLERLFFLEDDPGSPDNRTFYVGLNRTVASPNRNGCGARRALAIVQ
ncbi:MAG TPA: hypothetical protein VLF66_12990 [Thermoanaerobaculia bacterium]|nr:hypothetical protein [Thermoanaerobaculia bacterium]